MAHVASVAKELLQKPAPQRLQRLVLELESFAKEELSRGAEFSAPVLRAFAEVCAGAKAALRSNADQQLRWAASSAAALLLSYVVTLQPAQAADVVNYSDFIDSINRGEVEMVRVQEDMLSAQYTTKDGSTSAFFSAVDAVTTRPPRAPRAPWVRPWDESIHGLMIGTMMARPKSPPRQSH